MSKPSETIRRTIERSGVSRYRIAHETGIAESTLSRFMAGQGLNLESIDTLAAYLGLTLVPETRSPKRAAGAKEWRA